MGASFEWKQERKWKCWEMGNEKRGPKSYKKNWRERENLWKDGGKNEQIFFENFHKMIETIHTKTRIFCADSRKKNKMWQVFHEILESQRTEMIDRYDSMVEKSKLKSNCSSGTCRGERERSWREVSRGVCIAREIMISAEKHLFICLILRFFPEIASVFFFKLRFEKKFLFEKRVLKTVENFENSGSHLEDTHV